MRLLEWELTIHESQWKHQDCLYSYRADCLVCKIRRIKTLGLRWLLCCWLRPIFAWTNTLGSATEENKVAMVEEKQCFIPWKKCCHRGLRFGSLSVSETRCSVILKVEALGDKQGNQPPQVLSWRVVMLSFTWHRWRREPGGTNQTESHLQCKMPRLIMQQEPRLHCLFYYFLEQFVPLLDMNSWNRKRERGLQVRLAATFGS